MKFLANLVAQFFRWLASRNEFAATPAGQQAEADKRRAAEQAEIAQAGREVRNKDMDGVNKRLKDLYPALILAALLAAGCQTVTYVPAGAAAVPMERDGQPGWWVPEGVFALLLEDAITVKNLSRRAQNGSDGKDGMKNKGDAQ